MMPGRRCLSGNLGSIDEYEMLDGIIDLIGLLEDYLGQRDDAGEGVQLA
jgi:hypothetical protein